MTSPLVQSAIANFPPGSYVAGDHLSVSLPDAPTPGNTYVVMLGASETNDNPSPVPYFDNDGAAHSTTWTEVHEVQSSGISQVTGWLREVQADDDGTIFFEEHDLTDPGMIAFVLWVGELEGEWNAGALGSDDSQSGDTLTTGEATPGSGYAVGAVAQAKDDTFSDPTNGFVILDQDSTGSAVDDLSMVVVGTDAASANECTVTSDNGAVGLREAVGLVVLFSPSGAGPSLVEGSATLTGTGSLTAAGTRTAKGSAALAGTGSLAAAGTRKTFGSAALSGAGALAAAGTRIAKGSATLHGEGSLAAAGARTAMGSAHLTGNGALSTDGTRTRFGSAVLAGMGALAAAGFAKRSGSATLHGDGVLDADGFATRTGSATLHGAGSLAADGRKHAFGSALLAGIGSLIAAGFRKVTGTATLHGTGSLTADGVAATPPRAVQLRGRSDRPVRLRARDDSEIDLKAEG